MKWVLIEKTHINMELVTSFVWCNGFLNINLNGGRSKSVRDPGRELYLKLCHRLGVRPAEEVQE